MEELERKTGICVCWSEGREGLGCAVGLGCLDGCYPEAAERERRQRAEWRLDPYKEGRNRRLKALVRTSEHPTSELRAGIYH